MQRGSGQSPASAAQPSRGSRLADFRSCLGEQTPQCLLINETRRGVTVHGLRRFKARKLITFGKKNKLSGSLIDNNKVQWSQREDASGQIEDEIFFGQIGPKLNSTQVSKLERSVGNKRAKVCQNVLERLQVPFDKVKWKAATPSGERGKMALVLRTSYSVQLDNLENILNTEQVQDVLVSLGNAAEIKVIIV